MLVNYQEKSEKQNNIVLLAKTGFNDIKVLISKALINSNINHGEFVSVNHVYKNITR